MKKKEIVTLALTTALLMTAHAVPASAASNAPESMSVSEIKFRRTNEETGERLHENSRLWVTAVKEDA